MAENFADLKRNIESLSSTEKDSIFKYLRKDQLIHPLENEFGAPAEVILEAISRSSDLTKRGVRGIIAEASFKVEVLNKLKRISVIDIEGDHPFDFLVEKDGKRISIQVKMQRLKNKKPMTANEGYRFLSEDYFVVETQKTRGGKDKDGQDTRPYKFGEFDILAVSMHPSSGKWEDFLYTLTNRLLPNPKNPELILKFQPVPKFPDEFWTNDFNLICEELLIEKACRIKGLK